MGHEWGTYRRQGVVLRRAVPWTDDSDDDERFIVRPPANGAGDSDEYSRTARWTNTTARLKIAPRIHPTTAPRATMKMRRALMHKRRYRPSDRGGRPMPLGHQPRPPGFVEPAVERWQSIRWSRARTCLAANRLVFWFTCLTCSSFFFLFAIGIRCSPT